LINGITVKDNGSRKVLIERDRGLNVNVSGLQAYSSAKIENRSRLAHTFSDVGVLSAPSDISVANACYRVGPLRRTEEQHLDTIPGDAHKLLLRGTEVLDAVRRNCVIGGPVREVLRGIVREAWQ